MSSTHTAIASTSLGVVELIQVPTAKPGPGQVLLKHEYASMVAFDTYISDLGYIQALGAEYPVILGINTAGIVQEVGEGVHDLAVGDHVTAFSYQDRGLQEHSVQPRTVVAKIPDELSLAEAASIPDNFITAYGTLFNPLYFSLPIPSSLPAKVAPADASKPVLIYGAGSTTGQYAIQLLSLAGYKTIIATASPHNHGYLLSLGATHVFDYNSPSLESDVAAAVKSAGQEDGKVERVLDCVTSEGTLAIIAKLVSNKGTVALLMPVKEGSSVRAKGDQKMYFEFPPGRNPLPSGTKHVRVRTFMYQENQYLKENLMPKILPELLTARVIKPNRIRLLEGGTLLGRVEIGLDLLRNNKISGEKVIVKIQD